MAVDHGPGVHLPSGGVLHHGPPGRARRQGRRRHRVRRHYGGRCAAPNAWLLTCAAAAVQLILRIHLTAVIFWSNCEQSGQIVNDIFIICLNVNLSGSVLLSHPYYVAVEDQVQRVCACCQPWSWSGRASTAPVALQVGKMWRCLRSPPSPREMRRTP